MAKKWTEAELETHIKVNCDYGGVIVASALFKKLYGRMPNIGLSGFQGSGVDSIIEVLPATEDEKAMKEN